MRRKRVKNVMKISAAVLFLVCTVSGVITIRGEAANLVLDGKELFVQIQLFADAITLVSADYVKEVTAKDLVYGAIKGMMETLDGYSQFMDPENFMEIQEETKGEFGGVGIEIGFREGALTVISPLDGTPADKAGILPGDRIMEIGGEITQGMTLDEVVKKLRGKPKTEVTFTVVREGIDRVLDFTITRAVIKIESIKDSKIIDNNIAYIKILEFQERTAKDLEKSLEKLLSEGAEKLILDLRNNPGGLLDTAVKTSDLFLDKGQVIVYTEGREALSKLSFEAKKESAFNGIDMIILINKGSASAAEIFSGAMADNGRGLLIGNSTFGKGSVQTVFPLRDESALRLTTASYFTPSGRNLMDKGIEPDIFVEDAVKDQDKDDEEKTESKKEDPDAWKDDPYITTAVDMLREKHVPKSDVSPREQ